MDKWKYKKKIGFKIRICLKIEMASIDEKMREQ